jgi:hypothetical protein
VATVGFQLTFAVPIPADDLEDTTDDIDLAGLEVEAEEKKPEAAVPSADPVPAEPAADPSPPADPVVDPVPADPKPADPVEPEADPKPDDPLPADPATPEADAKEPEAAPIEPVADPKPDDTLTADPVKAEADPVEPAADPIPADPVEPAADPVEPAADPVEPAADPVEPAADPVEPAADPVEPATDPVEPAADPVPAPADITHDDPAPSVDLTPPAVESPPDSDIVETKPEPAPAPAPIGGSYLPPKPVDNTYLPPTPSKEEPAVALVAVAPIPVQSALIYHPLTVATAPAHAYVYTTPYAHSGWYGRKSLINAQGIYGYAQAQPIYTQTHAHAYHAQPLGYHGYTYGYGTTFHHPQPIVFLHSNSIAAPADSETDKNGAKTETKEDKS